MTLYLNCNDNDFSFNKKQYLLRAAKRLGIDFVKDIVQVGDEPKDYVLNIEPYDFVKGNKWTGIWEIDLLLDRKQLSEKEWESADTVFTAISTVPPRFKKFRTVLLPQAVDSEIHRFFPDITKTSDVCFMGSMHDPTYRKRIEAYELLKKHFNCQFYDKTKIEDYMSKANGARVQFIRSMATDIADGELAQRFFECLAVGPVLTNYVKDLEHTGLVEGEDYLSYRDDFEMLTKLRYLLDNPEYANKVAINGRRKAGLYHLYEHRLITISNYAFDNNTD